MKRKVFMRESVRVQFEIGHEASVRTKKTPEGFTHDWEVFVRGADNTDIQCFVDKVVFHLHETFPKPRRVIKEPPYVVKESGYAGFVLPIDVYLKNKEEPKKINFQYDLQLQNSGPPISRVLREPRVFQNPSEDFRRKLIRGGGVGVDTPSEVSMEESKHPSTSSFNKAKVESPVKKYKPELPLSNSFADLFGTPIRRITPEPKKVADQAKKVPEVDSKDKKKLSKHSPHKDEKERDRYDKERVKEREKVKEKPSKRPPSPQPVPVPKPKEEHKKYEEKEKNKKEEYDEKKKRKEEREKKEKHNKEVEKLPEKEHKKDKKEYNMDYLKKAAGNKVHESLMTTEKHGLDAVEKEKDRNEKEKHKHRHKKKEKEKNREKEKHKKEKEKIEKDFREKEREKEKMVKRKQDELKEREEKMKRKSKSPSPVVEKVKKGPLNALLDELGSSDSASQLSEEEDSIPSFKSLSKTNVKNVPEVKIQPVANSNPKLKSTNLNISSENKLDKEITRNARSDETSPSKNKNDKSPGKKNKKSDKDADKRRLKEEHKGRTSSCDREKENDDIEKLKREKEERERLEKEQLEKERLERERLEAEKPKVIKREKETNRKRKREKTEDTPMKIKKEVILENNVLASQSTGITELAEASEDNRKPEKFTKEYVAQLRDLQRRIMTLEDNAELQKVVQVIAETGQYEITKKTFDFDLCALDSSTVRRLQEFFSTT